MITDANDVQSLFKQLMRKNYRYDSKNLQILKHNPKMLKAMLINVKHKILNSVNKCMAIGDNKDCVTLIATLKYWHRTFKYNGYYKIASVIKGIKTVFTKHDYMCGTSFSENGYSIVNNFVDTAMRTIHITGA